MATSGFVEKIVGGIDGIQIERNGTSLRPAILLPLRAGDRIVALRPDSAVHIQLGNRRIVIGPKDSPFLIPSLDAPPGFLSRLQSTLVSVGTKLTTQYVHTSVAVSASSRGHEGPLSIPMVEDGVSRLGAGRSDLYIAWEGGTPPFLVKLLASNGRELAKQEVGEAWRAHVRSNDGTLPEGDMQLVIEDGAGDRAQKVMTVVPAASLPPMKAVLTNKDIPGQLKIVLAADALLQANRRIWTLEAYQGLAALGDTYEPAHLFSLCLEHGASCYR